jgi:hypothetical protein
MHTCFFFWVGGWGRIAYYNAACYIILFFNWHKVWINWFVPLLLKGKSEWRCFWWHKCTAVANSTVEGIESRVHNCWYFLQYYIMGLTYILNWSRVNCPFWQIINFFNHWRQIWIQILIAVDWVKCQKNTTLWEKERQQITSCLLQTKKYVMCQ